MNITIIKNNLILGSKLTFENLGLNARNIHKLRIFGNSNTDLCVQNLSSEFQELIQRPISEYLSGLVEFILFQ